MLRFCRQSDVASSQQEGINAMNRPLLVVSGLAVLFTTLGYCTVLYHATVVHHLADQASFLAGVIAAALIGVLSFVGGLLLLIAARRQSPK